MPYVLVTNDTTELLKLSTINSFLSKKKPPHP